MPLSATHEIIAAAEHLDVLVVGAGFGGLYQLHHLREKGYKVKVVDKASGLGGVWYWNRYPGACVDSDIPSYEYGFEELYKDWTWSERFPSREEVLRYFRYVDEKLDLSKDVMLNTGAVGAEFDTRECRWKVELSTGKVVECKYFVLCTGYATKKYIPDFVGLDRYTGIMHHTAAFPQDGINFEGKNVAVIGTGASGVQIIQEVGPEVARLTVFQRTPDLCLPMMQRAFDPEVEAEAKQKGYYDWVHEYKRGTFSGLHFDFSEKGGGEDDAFQKRAFYEQLWSGGGFRFWLASYKDLLFNKAVNDTAYEFWAEKTRVRIHDPKKTDTLAPLLEEQHHPFGTKRPSLEQRYYEVFNQDNVDVIALKQNGIETFTETGIKMENGDEHVFDVVILATGFDFVTGGLCQIDIKGTDGVSLADKWSKGTRTYLGMATANFPNMFFIYGPQAPTAFVNGPTMIEMQGGWVIDAIDYCTEHNKKTIDATLQSEAEWTKHVAELCDMTLLPGTDSWYMGANIPGKPRESLNYTGGLPRYVKECREVAERCYAGFDFDVSYSTAIGSQKE